MSNRPFVAALTYAALAILSTVFVVTVLLPVIEETGAMFERVATALGAA